jgi:hypothetical protein
VVLSRVTVSRFLELLSLLFIEMTGLIMLHTGSHFLIF